MFALFMISVGHITCCNYSLANDLSRELLSLAENKGALQWKASKVPCQKKLNNALKEDAIGALSDIAAEKIAHDYVPQSTHMAKSISGGLAWRTGTKTTLKDLILIKSFRWPSKRHQIHFYFIICPGDLQWR
jgi:hypothetical protein